MSNKIYKLVEEWASPTYTDYETGEILYESCDANILEWWVVSYDPEEREIVEWVECFPSEEQANLWAEQHNVKFE